MSDKANKGKEKKKETAAPAKTAPKAEKPKAAKAQPLPMMLELAFTITRAAILLGCVAIAVISFISGATLLDIFIRVGATLLGLGGLMWGFTWFLTNGSIEARQAMAAKDAAKVKAEPDPSTFEVKA